MHHVPHELARQKTAWAAARGRNRLSKMLVNEPLVFVIDPARGQLAVTYAEPEHPLYFDRDTVALKSLDGHDEAEVFSSQHITNGDQLAVGLVSHLFQDGQTGGFAAVGSCQWAAPKIVEHDVVVVAIDDGSEVIGDPNIGVSPDNRVDAAI
jgi:hypothetical protein